ncbi:hypothetical protein [Janthinobacterium sp.]|uniref:hypothetical protein n=1 Tax=Janthinobacterium sp. TaxID=1871054 RepID=UPI00293D3B89|nr:hypothetical protein [Janthinobacterium sp.]
MDLLATVIVYAIAQGERPFAPRIIALGYAHLKTAIGKKSPMAAVVLAAIADLERAPACAIRLRVLRQALNDARLGGDVDVQMAAHTLRQQIAPLRHGEGSGSYAGLIRRSFAVAR